MEVSKLENTMSAIERLKQKIQVDGLIDIKFCLNSIEDKSNISVERTAEEVLQILNARGQATNRQYTDY